MLGEFSRKINTRASEWGVIFALVQFIKQKKILIRREYIRYSRLREIIYLIIFFVELEIDLLSTCYVIEPELCRFPSSRQFINI